MSNEALGAIMYHSTSARFAAARPPNCRRHADRPSPGHDAVDSPLHQLELPLPLALRWDAGGTNGFRDGGRRPAGEHRAEHLWQPP
eukprot:947444-Prymnesium_polylepis.1